MQLENSRSHAVTVAFRAVITSVAGWKKRYRCMHVNRFYSRETTLGGPHWQGQLLKTSFKHILFWLLNILCKKSIFFNFYVNFCNNIQIPKERAISANEQVSRFPSDVHGSRISDHSVSNSLQVGSAIWSSECSAFVLRFIAN